MSKYTLYPDKVITDCEMSYLRNEHIHYLDCEFARVRMIRCTFTDCIFTNVEFHDPYWTECSFTDCVFRDCTFEAAREDGGFDWMCSDDVAFETCLFPGSKFIGMNFSGMLLVSCDFSGALCHKCRFDEVSIEDNTGRPTRFPPTDVVLPDLHYMYVTHVTHHFIRVGCKGQSLEKWLAMTEEEFSDVVSSFDADWTFLQRHKDRLETLARECPKEEWYEKEHGN